MKPRQAHYNHHMAQIPQQQFSWRPKKERKKHVRKVIKLIMRTIKVRPKRNPIKKKINDKGHSEN